MNKKYILYFLIFGIIIFISIPAFHLIKTYLNEDNIEIQVPKGFTNDASELSLTKVDSIIDVPNSKSKIVAQLREILKLHFHFRISIHKICQSQRKKIFH